uniref:photosystem II protein W n=1 Tax=Fibrocapsa japonica TaxID=94617 RepID=UPI00211494BA|nr:photosystem II protein W [Fibrocapsa japonica]UTE95242.1 photosystem II protein W [Fibrocapsa japonica]
MTCVIQFIPGINEKVLPNVTLTRSRDGSTGTATFRFKSASLFEKDIKNSSEITGMFLIDDEGILITKEVSARFLNGKPESIEAVYIMKNREAWDRFMRFMERYGQENGLTFTKAN